ncbi:MAG TPA: AMP-binding protein [Solirubrobacteraceae bacterium]|nr:AMP-binding protein [Solirubrobacteraceae bacterium]
MPIDVKTITRPVGRIGAAAQNALEVARFGGLTTDEEPSPYEVVSEQRVYRLRRYYADASTQSAAPVLLVPPLMLAAEVYDVSPRTSAVTILHEHGVDPWVVDFGAPEKQEGGLERTLADHVLAVSEAVDRVRAHTGREVHLAGYSQGGMFCYQTAAYRRNDGLSSVITFGSPVDTRLAMPFGLPEQFAAGAAGVLADRVFRGWALPAWASRTGFRLLDPVKSLRSRIDFILQLHDREALLPREGQRRFLEAEGWVAWPGPAMADFLRQFIAHNRMLEGGFVIEDRLVTLADLECPILSVVGSVDEIAPAPGVRAVRLAAPRADVYELCLRAGHFGLVVGSLSNHVTWPTVAAWARWRAGEGGLPENVKRITDETALDLSPRVRNRVVYGAELATAVGTGMARSALGAARRTVGSVRELTREAAGQLPRLARLEQIQPSTRISLGLLVDERRRKVPDENFFLFEDRAYSARQVNERIDNVVRGLLSIGVRQGEHIGVLMGPRPSALALAAAISRVGAVAVLLRPDADVAREAELGQVERIIADPERAPLAAGLGELHTFVLGGGGGPRDLGIPLAGDMEQIDPDAVTLPRWYRPNPGRASDLAFILFTGEGANIRMNRITNKRWALSAFGTASSAALGDGDTVYSVTPLYHPSGLMMSIGGAVAGGARLALASRFEPATFWEETRRYGVTVASYTWTLLHELVDAPLQPGERHHPVRLFIGSGMPRGLWRRVQERFKPARVLEFYASTEAGAILVNLSGAKPGSMGRPLPGSSEVRIAAYDADAGGLVLERSGFARECRVDEVGMLLARVRPADPTTMIPMRGVFARDDAWLLTGDLFRRDGDGDYWRIDHVGDVIHTPDGAVFTGPIRDALGDLPAVDLAVAYGVTPPGAAHELAVAAVTVRAGRELRGKDIGMALRGVPRERRPAIVHVVEQIPVTTWFRPITGPLRSAGLPHPGPGVKAWYRDASGETYRPLTEAAHRRLTRSAAGGGR